MKPKTNRKPGPMDCCQTPPYALDAIIEAIPREWTIWEPACGEGLLSKALMQKGYSVISSDIEMGQDFFEYEPDEWDCLITNPPYSLKYEWTERCYKLGEPFALLMPVEMVGTVKGMNLFDKRLEMTIVLPRINFKMPNKGYDGHGAQFPTAWYTYMLKSPGVHYYYRNGQHVR